jgi:hypothetical protein
MPWCKQSTVKNTYLCWYRVAEIQVVLSFLSPTPPVMAQPELFEIFCILESQKDNLERAFVVDIAKTETVSHLKQAIKAEKAALANYDADSIVLNRVEILAEGDFKENVKNATQTKLGIPMQELSAVFPTGPQKNMVHIIVQPPPERESTSTASSVSRIHAIFLFPFHASHN